ncbi:MAG: hypothetical protein EBT20_05245 [Alphaproteobacteria bacterium]|nr:hypothetical protein [Alphaproteobacteria bacterium]
MNFLNLFLAVLASMAALLTYQIKNKVSGLNRDIARIERLLVVEQERIEVQKAEWAYLTAPARLEKLAREHLDLDTPATAQLARVSMVPMRPKRSSKGTLLRFRDRVPFPVSRARWYRP